MINVTVNLRQCIMFTVNAYLQAGINDYTILIIR